MECIHVHTETANAVEAIDDAHASDEWLCLDPENEEQIWAA